MPVGPMILLPFGAANDWNPVATLSYVAVRKLIWVIEPVVPKCGAVPSDPCLKMLLRLVAGTIEVAFTFPCDWPEDPC
jgi:hypothetical protein